VRGVPTLYNTTKQVFSNSSYLIIAASVFVSILALLLYERGILFFQPYIVFQLSQDLIPDFILIVMTSVLVGIVSSMTVYQISMQNASTKSASSGVAGSLMGIGTSVCTSCTQIGFTIISTLGAGGAAALSLISNYEIPLRIVSVALLTLSFFFIAKSITAKCKIM